MAATNTYQRVWSKYLPVITLKVKHAISKNELQVLNLDRFDFENAGTGTKKTTSLSFNIEFKQGLALNSGNFSAIARDFAHVVNENETLRGIVRDGHFTFKLGNKFVLSIQKN